jgi:uncharacterized protein
MTQPLSRNEHPIRNRGIGVLILMALLLPPAAWSLSKIKLNNDIRGWVPEGDPSALKLAWYHEYFPESESAMVSWEGSTLNDPRVEWLKARLEGVPDADGVHRNGSRLIERVVTPQDLLRRIELSDEVSHEEALARLQGLLVGKGPLKFELTDYGQKRRDSVMRQLQIEVEQQLGLQLQTLEPVSDWKISGNVESLVLPEAIVEAEEVLEPFAPLREHHAQVRWDGMHAGDENSQKIIGMAKALRLGADDNTKLVEDAFYVPGSPLTIAVVLNEAGVEDKRTAIAEIRQIASEVGIPEETLHLGGRPVAGTALNDSVKRAGWNREYPISNLPGRSIILFSGLVSIVLAFILLRSIVLASLVIGVSYYTVILTTSLVPAFGGSMNMVIVVMPSLLLVLTISGAIHVANYWRFASRNGEADAPGAAVKLARRPCFLASLTTAFGLMSLMTSPLGPVADFGLYSAIGCFLGLGVILYGLPAMLRYVPEKVARPTAEASPVWPAVGRQISKRPVTVAVACLVLFGVCSAGLTNFRTETKVIRFFPEGSRIVQDYHWLEENISGIVPIDVVVRFSESDRFPSDGGLFLAERQEIVRKIQNRIINEHPDVTGAVSLATFRPGKTEEELVELAEKRKQLMDGGMAAFQAAILTKSETSADQLIKEPGSPGRQFVADATSDADLDKPGDNRLCRKGDELWRITAQVNIMTDTDYGDLTAAVDKTVREEASRVAGASHIVTGMVPLFLKTQEAVLQSLIESFLIAFVVIGAVICYLLGSVRAGLLTMLPNVLPISTVFGAISWFSIRIDIGTMITASVALGIAVDGTLHLLTWFRHGISNGRTRRVAISEALDHCGPALCQTSIAVGIGLFVLLPAELSLISRFGWLMSAMIVTALFADLVLLPSLLASKLGWWIMKADVEKQIKQASEDADSSDQSQEAAGDSEGTSQAELPAESEERAQPKAPHMLRSSEATPKAEPGTEIA